MVKNSKSFVPTTFLVVLPLPRLLAPEKTHSYRMETIRESIVSSRDSLRRLRKMLWATEARFLRWRCLELEGVSVCGCHNNPKESFTFAQADTWPFEAWASPKTIIWLTVIRRNCLSSRYPEVKKKICFSRINFVACVRHKCQRYSHLDAQIRRRQSLQVPDSHEKVWKLYQILSKPRMTFSMVLKKIK